MSYRRNVVVQEPHIHVVIIRIPKETANVHFAMWKPFYVFKYISLLILFTAYGIMLNVRFVFFVFFFADGWVLLVILQCTVIWGLQYWRRENADYVYAYMGTFD